MNPPYHGQCLCGGIQYEVDAIEPQMGHCHCSMCRKFHGAAFATFGEAKAENFRWLKGEELLESYQADNKTVRRFCKVCGSSMTFAAAEDNGEIIEFTLGTLNDTIPNKPDSHIHLNSKVEWFTIADNLPQFKEGRMP